MTSTVGLLPSKLTTVADGQADLSMIGGDPYQEVRRHQSADALAIAMAVAHRLDGWLFDQQFRRAQLANLTPQFRQTAVWARQSVSGLAGVVCRWGGRIGNGDASLAPRGSDTTSQHAIAAGVRRTSGSRA
jgi:hypothetical protein